MEWKPVGAFLSRLRAGRGTIIRITGDSCAICLVARLLNGCYGDPDVIARRVCQVLSDSEVAFSCRDRGVSQT